MADDTKQPNGSDRSEQAKSEPAGQQARQSPAHAKAPPDKRIAPGRKPLFRT
jgi:hypothetical protein